MNLAIYEDFEIDDGLCYKSHNEYGTMGRSTSKLGKQRFCRAHGEIYIGKVDVSYCGAGEN